MGFLGPSVPRFLGPSGVYRGTEGPRDRGTGRAGGLHSSPSMLKPRNLGAYRDLLVLFTKYGRKDFRLATTTEELIAPETPQAEVEPDVQARAEAFAKSLREMGPTYVK